MKMKSFLTRSSILTVTLLSAAYIGSLAYSIYKYENSLNSYDSKAKPLKENGYASLSDLTLDKLSLNPLNNLDETKYIDSEKNQLDTKLQSAKQFLRLDIQRYGTERERLSDLNTKIDPFAEKDDFSLEEYDDDDIYDLYEALTLTKSDLLDHKIGIEIITQEKKDRGELVNPLWLKTDDELKNLLMNMSIEEKAGQILMFGAEGDTATQYYLDQLAELQSNGIIMMGANIKSKEQTTNYINAIQSDQTTKDTNPLPFFIATDQEGGYVKRIDWDDTAGTDQFTSIGKEKVCELSQKRAEVLLEAGININFAPVVDLTNTDKSAFINNRTISSDPKIVSELSSEFSRCSESTGVFTTLKHYPGHGATIEDSHYYLPKIDKSLKDWLAADAVPFKENSDRSSLVMVGHLLYYQIDKNDPASQSPKLIKYLREDFDFDGVIITDDMMQLHRSTNVDSKTAIKKAINSDIDILLYVGTPESPKQTKADLVDLIKSNEISEEEVNDSVLRILKLKRDIIFGDA